MEEGDGEVGKLAFAQFGTRSLKPQNLLSLGLIVLGCALLLYFGRNGILQEMVHSPDLFAVIAILIVVNLVLFVSLTKQARAFINRHAKQILKIGIAMFLFSFLSPFILLAVVLLFNLDANKLLPMRYFDSVMWGDFAVGGVGMLVAMIPSHVKFFEYLRTTGKK